MPNLHKLFSVVFFVLFSILTAQDSTHSIRNGNWNQISTWDNGVPGPSKSAIIISPHTVTIPTAETALMLNLRIDSGGTLNAESYYVTLEVFGDWLNNGTFDFTPFTDNLVKFRGTEDQEVRPGGDGFEYIELNNTGSGSGNKIKIKGNIDISQNLTFTKGTLDLTDGGNPTVDIGGNVTILNGAVWTKGNGTVTFDGSSQTFDDQNGSPNNIGNIVVE